MVQYRNLGDMRRELYAALLSCADDGSAQPARLRSARRLRRAPLVRRRAELQALCSLESRRFDRLDRRPSATKLRGTACAQRVVCVVARTQYDVAGRERAAVDVRQSRQPLRCLPADFGRRRRLRRTLPQHAGVRGVDLCQASRPAHV